MIDLEESSLDLHLWLSKLLHQLNNAVDFSLRISEEVDFFELGSSVWAFLLDSLSDFGGSHITFVVAILKFDQGNSGSEYVEVKCFEKLRSLINQEKKLVLVIDPVKVVDAAGARG